MVRILGGVTCQHRNASIAGQGHALIIHNVPQKSVMLTLRSKYL